MNKTKEEMSEMAEKKINSKRMIDRLVADELLQMGFSYDKIGTHYLHESIVHSVLTRLEDSNNVNEFCRNIGKIICKKYSIRKDVYDSAVARAIEAAFQVGNINYLLDTFKNSYDRDKMKVTKNAFIMTVRRKILAELEEMEEQGNYNVTQLRIIIQGELEGISDVPVLEGIRNILFSLKGEGLAVV